MGIYNKRKRLHVTFGDIMSADHPQGEAEIEYLKEQLREIKFKLNLDYIQILAGRQAKPEDISIGVPSDNDVYMDVGEGHFCARYGHAVLWVKDRMNKEL